MVDEPKREQVPIDQRIMFAVCPDGQGDGVPMLLIGVPIGAWQYMRDGKTHNLDLTSIGIPLKLMMFGAKDHDTCKAVVEAHNKMIGNAALDMRNKDFSIQPLDTSQAQAMIDDAVRKSRPTK